MVNRDRGRQSGASNRPRSDRGHSSSGSRSSAKQWQGHRPERVGSLLREACMEIIPTIADPLVNSGSIEELITINDVKVSDDLSAARLYISTRTTPARRQEIIEGLRRAAGYIRHELRSRVDLRIIPNLSFEADDTLDKAMRIEAILKQWHESKPQHSEDDSEQ